MSELPIQEPGPSQFVPVQTVFRDMSIRDDVESICWIEAAKLKGECAELSSCLVVISALSSVSVCVSISLVLSAGEVERTQEFKETSDQCGDLGGVVVRAFDGAGRTLRRFSE